MTRRLLVALVLAAAVVVTVAVVAMRRLQDAQARAGVVTLEPTTERALEEIAQRTFPRPVHRDVGVPGRFGDANDAEHWSRADAALDGAPCAPGTSLDAPACRAYLDGTRLLLTTLLDATLRAEGGLGPARAIFAPIGSGATRPLPGFARGTLGVDALPLGNFDAPRTILRVSKRAALEIADLAARGDDASSLRVCGDAMAWARDATLGGNMIQLMTTLAALRAVRAACDAAARAASPHARAELRRALAVVRPTLPAVGDIARDDMVVSWLFHCGEVLDDAGRARLGPLARAKAAEAERLRASAGASALEGAERRELASDCRDAQPRLSTRRTMTIAALEATDEVRRYHDEAQAVYAELDALIAGLAPKP
jgi:hypothetical protein